MSELVEALTTLQIGESIGMGDTDIMAVPGGWVFTTNHPTGVASCFVPLPANQVEMPKVRPSIITNH